MIRLRRTRQGGASVLAMSSDPFWTGGSQSTIPFGTPEELRCGIRTLRGEMSVGGGYILAPAKSLQSKTPTENAMALVEEFLQLSSRLCTCP